MKAWRNYVTETVALVVVSY